MWGGEGSTLTASLTVRYPLFFDDSPIMSYAIEYLNSVWGGINLEYNPEIKLNPTVAQL